MAARKKTPAEPVPYIGMDVHYVADSIPGEPAGHTCCAATVTAIRDDGPALCVLMPAGFEFREAGHTLHLGAAVDEPSRLCAGLGYEAATWHPAVTA